MFTCLTPESTRLKASLEFVASRRVCLRPDIWDVRTEAEVERIEARTRIKAGAPVCSDGAYCVRRQIRRRIGPSRCSARKIRTKTDTVPVSYRCVFSHDSPSSDFQLRPLTNC